ncbi:MAG TPA: VWA domain-containing protein [Vicinamibacterales bacterium]|nr:VWA domain-containing protein [Vicinamibacterales bacterium]
MKRLAIASALALFGFSVLTGRAQTQTPAFKAGVELVRLDVQITDEIGAPIRDVKADELEVFESGVRRPIVFFQHVEEPTESDADIRHRTVDGDVSTNQGAARGHLYVLVFDQQHLSLGREERARIAAERFLRTRLRPGDRAAVYLLPGPGVPASFTADVNRLVTALRSVRGLAQPIEQGPVGSMTLQEAFQIARGDELTLRKVSDRIRNETPTSDTIKLSNDNESDSQFKGAVREEARAITTSADAESRRMLSMLRDVLRPLYAIEGRKTVLFFSEGFNGDNLTREIEDVAAAAAESYSVIDAVDLSRRGFDAAAEVPATTDPSIGIAENMTPIGGLAAATGGRLLLDGDSRIEQIFAAIGSQSQDYYLVGFAPREGSPGSRDEYRHVEVRIRRGGARVSTRTGVSLADPAAQVTRRDAIDRALAAPFVPQALPVRYTTYVLRGEASGLQRVVVSLESDLPLASPGAAAADVVFVVRGVPDGRVVASGTDRIPLPAGTRTGTSTGTGTGTFHVQFEAPSGTYVMRAAVREPGGLVGAADRRFTVPVLDGPSAAAGDLVVSAKGGDLPVRPAVAVGETLTGVIELYGRTADQLRDARVEMDLIPVGDEAALTTVVADLGSARALAGGVARMAHIELPIQGFAPGAYLARATVKVGQDTIAQRLREIEVQAAPGVGSAAVETFDAHQVAAGSLAREFAASLDPSRAGASAAMTGIARLDASDFPGAIAALTQSLDLDPKLAKAAFLLGWAYHGAGDDRQAISAWRRAVFVDPSLVPAYLALADVYTRLSQRPLAIQALRAGLTAVPNSSAIVDRLSRLEPK